MTLWQVAILTLPGVFDNLKKITLSYTHLYYDRKYTR